MPAKWAASPPALPPRVMHGQEGRHGEQDDQQPHRHGEDKQHEHKVRKQDRTGGHYAENGAGSPDHRSASKKADTGQQKIDDAAGGSADQIERQELAAAPRSLQRRAEHVQAEHVQEDVPDAVGAVQELIADQPPRLQRRAPRARAYGKPRLEEIPQRPDQAQEENPTFAIISHLTTGVSRGRLKRNCGSPKRCCRNSDCV